MLMVSFVPNSISDRQFVYFCFCFYCVGLFCACSFVRSFNRSFVSLFVCLFGWLVGWLVGWFGFLLLLLLLLCFGVFCCCLFVCFFTAGQKIREEQSFNPLIRSKRRQSLFLKPDSTSTHWPGGLQCSLQFSPDCHVNLPSLFLSIGWTQVSDCDLKRQAHQASDVLLHGN